ncbi:MAG TPA: class I SAM-dependent methyltransferase [Candidatus Binatia bacterium]|nr:class I SAM-dependent methyltransferase [Candidatus Binatia bacterium]
MSDIGLSGPGRGLFDAWSSFYDLEAVQRATYRPVHRAVMRSLREEHAASILDVGCGTGQLDADIVRELPWARVVGCDFSHGMLRHAADRSDRVRWVQGDACRLPFHDARFDAVVSTEAFHWFPDPAAALAEFHRVLVPCGRILIAHATSPAHWVEELLHAASRLVGEPFRWPTQDEMRERVERAGFTVASQEHIARLPGGLLFAPILTTAVKPDRHSASHATRRPAAHA